MRMDEPLRKSTAKITVHNPRRGRYLTIAAVIVGLIAYAVFHRETGKQHPLRDTVRTDLCPLLPPAPVGLAVQSSAPQPGETRTATCEYKGAQNSVVLRVTLGSTKQLGDGGGLGLEPEFSRRLKRAKAQYGNGGEVPGDWDKGGAWHVGPRQSFLFIDDGVLVQLESDRLDAAALAAHAAAVAKALRDVPDSVR